MLGTMNSSDGPPILRDEAKHEFKQIPAECNVYEYWPPALGAGVNSLNTETSHLHTLLIWTTDRVVVICTDWLEFAVISLEYLLYCIQMSAIPYTILSCKI